LNARGARIKGERLPLANHFFAFWQAKTAVSPDRDPMQAKNLWISTLFRSTSPDESPPEKIDEIEEKSNSFQLQDRGL
jgi:hypothetical protein